MLSALVNFTLSHSILLEFQLVNSIVYRRQDFSQLWSKTLLWMWHYNHTTKSPGAEPFAMFAIHGARLDFAFPNLVC